jgi:hypothetical protein
LDTSDVETEMDFSWKGVLALALRYAPSLVVQRSQQTSTPANSLRAHLAAPNLPSSSSLRFRESDDVVADVVDAFSSLKVEAEDEDATPAPLAQAAKTFVKGLLGVPELKSLAPGVLQLSKLPAGLLQVDLAENLTVSSGESSAARTLSDHDLSILETLVLR